MQEPRGSVLRHTAEAVSRSRREFLRAATGACLAPGLLRSSVRAGDLPPNRKAVVVTFGGGARDDETFMPDGRQNIPHLLGELLPRGRARWPDADGCRRQACRGVSRHKINKGNSTWITS